MPRVLIGNRASDDLVGSWGKAAAGWWAQRLLWFVQDGDVVVLPEHPDEEFLDYVTSKTRTDRGTLRFVVPGPGDQRRDWLLDDDLVERLRSATAGEPVATVFALNPDSRVTALARALGAESAVPGYRFLDQGGAPIADSKAIFRAIAAGAGVPLPAGGVCANLTDARRLITSLLSEEHPVILKREFLAGGSGNEVLTLVKDIEVNGAETVVLEDCAEAVRDYLSKRWEWLTGGHRHRVVVERFHPGSQAVFAEFWIADDHIELAATGEMVAAATPDHSCIPVPGLSAGQHEALVAGGRRLCEVLQAMGYRGVLSADAIIVEGRVLFTEYNGIVTGSTHVYHMGRRVVGAGFDRDRVLREHASWQVASFSAALEHLAREGIAYDPVSRTGVVILSSWREAIGTVQYCVIAEDFESAARLQKRLTS